MALEDYIYEKPVIETVRLTLRKLTRSDVPDLEKWMPDKSIYTYWGKGPGKTDKNPSLLFEKEKKPTKSFHLGIVLKSSGEVIGELWVYLIENNRMAKVAIRFSKDYQGKGYATEALNAITAFCFDNTELQRLWTDVDVRNEASVRLLEKCGYKREGMIRQGKMVSSWCDYYLYGLLKSEYNSEKISRKIDI